MDGFYHNFGWLFLSRGDLENAHRSILRGLAVWQSSGFVEGRARCLHSLAIVAIADLEFLDTAADYLAQSLDLRRKLESDIYLAEVLADLASVELCRNRKVHTLPLLQESCEIQIRTGVRFCTPEFFEAAAYLALVVGDPCLARQFFSLASSLRDRMGIVAYPTWEATSIARRLAAEPAYRSPDPPELASMWSVDTALQEAMTLIARATGKPGIRSLLTKEPPLAENGKSSLS